MLHETPCRVTGKLDGRPKKDLDQGVPVEVRYDSTDQLIIGCSRQIHCKGPGCGGNAKYRCHKCIQLVSHHSAILKLMGRETMVVRVFMYMRVHLNTHGMTMHVFMCLCALPCIGHHNVQLIKRNISVILNICVQVNTMR